MQCSVAEDNSALVKAYEKALKSFQKGSTSEGEDSLDGKKEESGSGGQSKESDKEGTVTQGQWTVGSRCRAVWSGDGLLYPAALVSVEGERGRVKFNGYGNEEDVELSCLLAEGHDQPWREKEQWYLGSRCRAVWSEDGLVYPAVLVWKKGDRGRVRFEGYGNEEELELSALLPPEDLQRRMNKAPTAQVLQTGPASSCNTDWRKKEKSGSRGEASAITRPLGRTSAPQCISKSVDGGRGRSCSESGGEPKDRKEMGNWGERREKLHPFPFSPVPPPPVRSPNVLQHTPPPRPPPSVWPPQGGPEEGSKVLGPDVTTISSMLLSWYLCGYHTGYYMAMHQAKTSHENIDKEKHRPNFRYGKGTK
ncbi:hypothetical protein JZ751_024691 [Albula glossodonta]|uniref:Tudor domain-containing protein n=1 Tax=Albula glossodonta TaxID=121402 RepID=A0A8T2PLJ8_9TELE|nr:hypothetical protein JZ751_024691 [Albula glossodonta]